MRRSDTGVLRLCINRSESKRLHRVTDIYTEDHIVTEDMKEEYYKHHSSNFIVLDLLIIQGTSFFYINKQISPISKPNI